MYAKPFSIFLLLVCLGLASACNRVPATSNTKEVPPEVEQMKEDVFSGEMTAADALVKRLEMRSVTLTEEQKRKIAEIGSKYDLTTKDRSLRRKQVANLLQQIEKEVLTPGQAEQLRNGSKAGKNGG